MVWDPCRVLQIVRFLLCSERLLYMCREKLHAECVPRTLSLWVTTFEIIKWKVLYMPGLLHCARISNVHSYRYAGVLLVLCIWSQHGSTVAVERWLGMVLSMLLLLICHGKEEVVLARLEDLELCMPSPGYLYGPVERHDPLNVAATIPKCKQLPPEQIMARWVIF